MKQEKQMTTNTSKQCVVFGSINLDYFFYVKNLPKPGETIFGHSFDTFSGGKGFNQAYYINQLCPQQCRFLAFIGDDSNGTFLKRKYNECNFAENDDLVVLPGNQSGCAFITVNNQGENTIIVHPGSNQDITLKIMAANSSAFKNCQYVISQCEIPLEIIDYGFSKAKKNNPNVVNILNLSPIPETDFLFLLKNVDILVVNEIEFEHICKNSNSSNFEEIHEKFQIESIICSRGAKSTLLYRKNESVVEVETVKVDNIVDTCGAGDSFLGGIVAGLMRDLSLPESIKFGNEVASKKIQKKSAQVQINDLNF